MTSGRLGFKLDINYLVNLIFAWANVLDVFSWANLHSSFPWMFVILVLSHAIYIYCTIWRFSTWELSETLWEPTIRIFSLFARSRQSLDRVDILLHTQKVTLKLMVKLLRVSYRSRSKGIPRIISWFNGWIFWAIREPTRFLRLKRHIQRIFFYCCLLFLSLCSFDPRLNPWSSLPLRRIVWSWRLNQIATLEIPSVLIFIECLQVSRLGFWHHVCAAALCNCCTCAC